MIWIKLVENFKFFGTTGDPREYRTTLQNFGLKVKNVIYAIEVLDQSSENAKIGIRHDQGASDNLNLLAPLDTPIPVATTAVPPTRRTQNIMILSAFLSVISCAQDRATSLQNPH